MKLPLSSQKAFALADAVSNGSAAVGEGLPTAAELRALGAYAEVVEKMPTIVCLIGSTRFFEEFSNYNLRFTLRGCVVLSIGCDTKKDGDLNYTDVIKHGLDIWKIIVCDEVFCINKDGYIGDSTAREVGFARLLNKPITFMEPMQSVRATYGMPAEMHEAMALAAAAGMRGRTTDGGYPGPPPRGSL
jgi:hypothetical protein